MYLHFPREEYASRLQAALHALQNKHFDGLLIFRQESMYYLTGYDTFGYVHFQCLYLHGDGRLTLLTRAPDRLQAQYTSIIEDIHIWEDRADADPYSQLQDIVKQRGASRRRLGIELEAYGLPTAKGLRVLDAFKDLCTLQDASELINELRLVKSEQELDYVRHAAALADASLEAAHRETRPGAFEGDILAAMQGAVYRGGGDDPANEQIIGSGPGALLCRYHSGRRHLDTQDQLTLEFAGVYRHYHACLMRTIPIGQTPPQQRAMHQAAVAALEAARTALTPGHPIGEVFDAHADVLDAAGFAAARMNACGYSLGATFAPNWMDWPMFYHGNPVLAAPGMVFFIHIILFDDRRGLAMSTGQTVEVTAGGAEPLTHAPLELVTR